MSATPADALLTFATGIAEDAMRTLRNRPTLIGTKTHSADLATDVDVAIERALRARISDRYPDDAICGEELGSRPGSSGRTWYLDPIDGTTNFVAGLPWVAVSVALADADGPLLGVLADTARGELLWASRGGGAFAGGARLTVTDHVDVSGSVVLTEWNGNEPWPGMHATLERVIAAGGTVRILGSTALTIAEVARGTVAGAFIGSHDLIDDAAALLIAAEAGAVIRSQTPGMLHGDGLLVAAQGAAAALEPMWEGAA
jgi:myo-inositol-1(or 4)-monophosphatase